MPDLIIIAAMGQGNHVIGAGNGMPWAIPEEYQQFLRLIEGQTIVMGRRSFEIFGPDLTTTTNLVVSRSVREVPGATVFADLNTALTYAHTLGKTIFSAGGASVYAQTIPKADAMYLSYIHGQFDGDTFFPHFDEVAWKETQREVHDAFTWVVYQRPQPRT